MFKYVVRDEHVTVYGDSREKLKEAFPGLKVSCYSPLLSTVELPWRRVAEILARGENLPLSIAVIRSAEEREHATALSAHGFELGFDLSVMP